MNHKGWHKSMVHFAFIYCSSPLNNQAILYDGNDIHFYDRVLNTIWSHHIHYFTLKVGKSVYNQPNDNGTKVKLNNLHDNAIMN